MTNKPDDAPIAENRELPVPATRVDELLLELEELADLGEGLTDEQIAELKSLVANRS